MAIVEKGESKGYSIYAANDAVPVVGSGLTEQEARQDFEQVMNEQARHIEEHTGIAPDWKDAEVEYRYDMSGFFQSFC